MIGTEAQWGSRWPETECIDEWVLQACVVWGAVVVVVYVVMVRLRVGAVTTERVEQ